MAAVATEGEVGTTGGWNVKFVPFSSAVDSPFWFRYCQEKLERIQLNEDAIPIRATFGVSSSVGTAASAVGAGVNKATPSAPSSGPPRLQCQENSLLLNQHDNNTSLIPNERIAVNGTLIGFNTKESFQKTDKNALIHDAFCPHFFNRNGDDDDDEKGVESLHSVLLLTFPDLKNHKVLYWFAFPALMTRSGKSIRAVQQEFFSPDDCTALRRHVAQMRLVQFQRQQQALQSAAAAAATTNTKDGNDDAKGSSNNNTSTAAVGLVPYFIWSKSKERCLPLSIRNYKLLVHDGHDDNSKDKEDGQDDEKEDGNTDHDGVVFGFFDPVAGNTNSAKQQLLPEAPAGWSLRNLVAYLSMHLHLGGKTVNILSYRPGRLHRLSKEKCNTTVEMEQQIAFASAQDDSSSILLKIVVPTKSDYKWDEILTTSGQKTKYRVVGWELNARGKSGPRSVNLRPILDPQHLAIQAADLNLKLMKWRQIPTLNVEKLQSTKALIIGAGTLGCNVARILLGWGVRNFKIIDNGKVSYSNPVRQPLFTLEDCHSEKDGSGRPKAVAAAEALKAIAADVVSEGLVLSIPMPGHPESRQVIAEAVEALDKLVQECDVVFLLTDTRESRWLPSIMAAAHDKMLINAALGLDSWLVMRHGGGCRAAIVEPSNNRDPPDKATARLFSEKQRLGCYFCNDIVAPENSTKNRTLDQQCTVTRPGLAPIASSMAVEMMVALLHHDDGTSAPAPAAAMSNFSPTVSAADGGSGSSISPLGVIPHQVRGSLVSYTMMKPTVPAFKSCTGCSSGVVHAYLHDKVGVVFSVCQSVEYLKNISGLTAFRAEAAEKMDDLDAWDEEEDDDGDAELK